MPSVAPLPERNMSQADLAATVDAAWEGRESISPATKGAWRDAVEAALDGLDDGSLRVAEPSAVPGEAAGRCING